MDSAETIKDWIAQNPELAQFDVPMLSDKENDIAGQFGVLMTDEADHPGSGYCANAVFIIDKFDKVRYHEALDPRMMLDIKEIKRLVKAFRATDGGKTIALPTWKEESDSVANSRSAIRTRYKLMYGSRLFIHVNDNKEEDVRTERSVECSDKSSWGYNYGVLKCDENI